MEIHQLKYFKETCRVSSYAAAAKNLRVSRQAVRSAVIGLERELGLSLLHVDSEGVAPTELGERFLEALEPLARQYQLFQDRLSELAESVESALTVGIDIDVHDALDPSFAAAQTSSTFAMFDRIRFSYEPRAKIIAKVADGRCDFGCVLGDPEDMEGFVSWQQQSHPIYCIVPDGHSFATRKSIAVEDLREQAIVTRGEGRYLHDTLLKRCREAGFAPRITVSDVGGQMLHVIVVTQNLLALTYSDCLPQDASEKVRAIPFSDKGMRWNAYSFKRVDLKPTYARNQYWKQCTDVHDVS